MNARHSLVSVFTWMISILFLGIIGFPFTVIITLTISAFISITLALTSLDILSELLLFINSFVAPAIIGWLFGRTQQRTLLRNYIKILYWWPFVSALLMVILFQLMVLWSEKYLQFGL